MYGVLKFIGSKVDGKFLMYGSSIFVLVKYNVGGNFSRFFVSSTLKKKSTTKCL